MLQWQTLHTDLKHHTKLNWFKLVSCVCFKMRWFLTSQSQNQIPLKNKRKTPTEIKVAKKFTRFNPKIEGRTYTKPVCFYHQSVVPTGNNCENIQKLGSHKHWKSRYFSATDQVSLFHWSLCYSSFTQFFVLPLHHYLPSFLSLLQQFKHVNLS